MSILFDGVGDNIDLGNGRSFMKGVPGATMMGWGMMRVLPPAFYTLVGAFGFTGTTRAKISINSAGNITWRCSALDADASSVFNSATALTAGPRVHIAAVVFFSSASGIIYVNGVSDTAGNFANMTPGNSSNTNCAQARIGSQELGGTNFWNGEIEDVRIYNRALGPGEIRSIYTSLGKDNILFGLQARYPMSDLAPNAAVSSVVDLSGNHFSGVAAGNPTFKAGITLQRGHGHSKGATGVL